MIRLIEPTWPAPANVRAYATTRQKGTSLSPYASFNLARHVGDDPTHVEHNRQLLAASLNLSSEPIWLQQTHSNKVITFTTQETPVNLTADAAITTLANMACTVMTADCLPILLCNRQGTSVAAIHAGWRGLANGIIENAIPAMQTSPSELLAWLGPAIGPDAFEVSAEVVHAFVRQDDQAIKAFKAKPGAEDKWLANIYLLAQQRLTALGVTTLYGGEHCTFSEQDTFYSYRRDGITGRMATLIWLSA